MPDFERRLAGLRSRMTAAGVDCVFLPESADLEYLTGVRRALHAVDDDWDAELLVQGCFIALDAGPLFLLTHSEWSIPAEAGLGPWDVRRMPAQDDPVEWLRAAWNDVGGDGRVLAVGDRTGFNQLLALRAAVGHDGFRLASPLILPLRASKDAGEVDAIRRGGAIALAALEDTLARFGSSFGRRDFLLELELALARRGSERIAYSPDVFATGPATAVPWSADVVLGDANVTISAPAAISLDFGAVVDGYRSDIGRTIWVGGPPAGCEHALEAVRRAQDAAVDILRPGVACEDVDHAARAVMEAEGLGDAFWIPSGHGIGLELHEPPRFRSGNRGVVAEDAVVTVEIGAWREATLSAFWEDDVVVRASGPERLTEGPDSAFVIA